MPKDDPDIDARLLVKLHRGENELTRAEKIFNKNPYRVRIGIDNSLANVKNSRFFPSCTAIPCTMTIHRADSSPILRTFACAREAKLLWRMRESALWQRTVA
jgi:hypothetical protein